MLTRKEQGVGDCVCRTSLTTLPVKRAVAFDLLFNLCPPYDSAAHSPNLNAHIFGIVRSFIHAGGECH